LGENTAQVLLPWRRAAYQVTFRRSSDRTNSRAGWVRRVRTRRFLLRAWPRARSYPCWLSMASGRTSSFSFVKFDSYRTGERNSSETRFATHEVGPSTRAILRKSDARTWADGLTVLKH